MSNTINLIKKEGKKVGISLKPKSKLELIENYYRACGFNSCYEC